MKSSRAVVRPGQPNVSSERQVRILKALHAVGVFSDVRRMLEEAVWLLSLLERPAATVRHVASKKRKAKR